MKIGVDLGNGYVKFGGNKFASRVKVGRLANFGVQRSDVYQVKYNNIDYIVGEGELFTTDDRYFTEDYLICLLTAISLAGEESVLDSVEICVGLPIQKYMSSLRTKFEKYLNELGCKKITIDGKEKIVNIKKATVFVEGAYIVESHDEGNVLTIDIGAGTVNIIQWENQSPVNFDTKNKSFYNLYEKIVKHIKDTGRGDITTDYIEKNLGADSIVIAQKRVDIKDTHKIIEKHIRELASQINSFFDVPRATKIQFLGGGALPTYKYWKNIYGEGTELIENSQYINSKIYQKVLEEMSE